MATTNTFGPTTHRHVCSLAETHITTTPSIKRHIEFTLLNNITVVHYLCPGSITQWLPTKANYVT